MGVFGASALVLIGVVWWTTVGYLEQQTNATIEAEVTGLVEQYRQRGKRGLEALIRERIAVSTGVPTVYLFADRDLKPLAGNLDTWPAGEADAEGWYNFSRLGEDGRRISVRGQVFVLSDGRHLLVAQDQSRLEATRSLINEAFLWALGGGLMLALAGGFLMSYSVMRRIEAINRASREIMTGRLQSRMPVRGINDEFDQLSENLNAMLDRIDSLIEGVKSVADNIAHDLRTPLTRLRGRLENLTARPGLDEELRGELTSAMTEADHLLATFRALLRIARIESDTTEREWSDVDLHPLLQDAWELYQAVGEEKDIHPKKKQPVGARLALAARGLAYGEKIEFSGPLYRRLEIKGDKAVLHFDHVGKGLEARGGELKGFAVSGDDKNFVWAKAEIAGNTVVVSSAAVARPVAVRFGWADFPVVNLWNQDGLPATPFRTDDFPMVTAPKN